MDHVLVDGGELVGEERVQGREYPEYRSGQAGQENADPAEREGGPAAAATIARRLFRIRSLLAARFRRASPPEPDID